MEIKADMLQMWQQALRDAFTEEKGELVYMGYKLSNRKAEITELQEELSKPLTEDVKPAHVLILSPGVAKLIRQSVKSYQNSNPKLKGRTLASWTIIQD